MGQGSGWAPPSRSNHGSIEGLALVQEGKHGAGGNRLKKRGELKFKGWMERGLGGRKGGQ